MHTKFHIYPYTTIVSIQAMVQEIIFKHSINITQASREVKEICKMTNKKVRRIILDEEVYIGYFGEKLAKYRPFRS